MYRALRLRRRGEQHAGRHPAAAAFLALLSLPGLACAADAPAIGAGDAPAISSADAPAIGSADAPAIGSADTAGTGSPAEPPSLPAGVPPPETPGLPSDAELEASGAVVGEILIDNQNIFNLDDPKDNNWLFRTANRLHARTRPRTIERQLLFNSGDRYVRRLLDESERILRANAYFYDAWIRPVKYHDGKVDVRVTTRDVWTLNPGFNYSRSGGTNSIGIQLEELNTAGTGTDLRLLHEKTVDRTQTLIQVNNAHLIDGWTAVALNYGDLSDGHVREFSVNRPFYALDTRHAGGVSGIDDAMTDFLYDRGVIIDEFHDQHNFFQAFGGWSRGLRNGWVQRWTTGVTYDEHQFSPLPTWTGPTLIPEDRRFVYPWVQFDLVQDDFTRFYNHNQILRTEDFYLGNVASLRVGWADTAYGSNQDALIFQSSAGRGFRDGGTSTLLVLGDFSGRLHDGTLYNGIADLALRYYAEQSRNWLFYTALTGTKGWRLDLDNQILLGGDNGLRGYPLRYQAGTARALWTIEQRYFTNWFPFRLWRVGGAIFFDAGRTWGQVPLAQPSLGLLKDAGFGLRIGQARSGLGNVIHVDLAFPFETAGGTIRSVQFLVQTSASF